jgi:sialate O-acetylesterase
MVELDGVVVGNGVVAADGTFDVTIGAQPASIIPHVIKVSVATNIGKVAAVMDITPKTIISDVLFGDIFLCAGQSNMYLMVNEVNNASAEIAAASWPLIRIATVNEESAATPRNDTQFRIPWGAVTSKNIPEFSAVCYYFGRRMFQELESGSNSGSSGSDDRGSSSGSGTTPTPTPIGLIQASIAGTYIQSFMPAVHMAACNTTGTEPPGWVPAPPLKPGSAPYNPWGGSNVPAALWNAMLNPLMPLQIKLAIYDQAEQNLATGESAKFRCLQGQLVKAWRNVWGVNLTFHAVQLPSINMSEYTWIYIDWETALGRMRLSQAGTVIDLPGVTTAATIDLADLHAPLGSVHNREKQEVGRRLALNALSTAYNRKLTNTGPTFKAVSLIASGNLLVHITTASNPSGGDGGHFNGSHDCSACCSESAFEVSADDGTHWTRVSRGPPIVAGMDVQVMVDARTVPGVTWLRYAYDWMVQCPFFDQDGLPLAPFLVRIGE